MHIATRCAFASVLASIAALPGFIKANLWHLHPSIDLHQGANSDAVLPLCLQQTMLHACAGQDDYSNPGTPFAVGLTLESLSAHTVDEAGKEAFITQDPLKLLRKVRAGQGV